ncbi:MAG: hypothetical protein N2202_02935 [Proteobacteria bacterium]|nr:hypothetical protein [Pseudomonadota bacterium]
MTLIVLSIIFVVVILGMRKPLDVNLDLATKKVYGDLSFIREKAISTNKRYKIYLQTPDIFMAGFGNYTLIINPDDQSKLRYKLGDKYPKVSFFKNYSVAFDGLGRNIFRTQTSIIIKTSTNQKIIKINPEHGRVYVY